MSSDRKDDQTPHARPDAAGHDADVHPEAPADAREQAQAASFAALLDRLTSGQALPPAMTAEERALVDTAGMVRASARPISAVALAPERQSALIDSVLRAARGATASATDREAPREAIGATRGHSGPDERTHAAGIHVDARGDAPARVPDRDQLRADRGDGRDVSGAIDMGERRRGRYFRALPWAVAMASIAAALLLMLWQSRSGPRAPGAPVVAQGTPVPALDTVHRSRPADALIGEIPRPAADAARARIDMIYADRLIGYRDLRLRGDRL